MLSNPTLLHREKPIKKKYWKKINNDTKNREKLFPRGKIYWKKDLEKINIDTIEKNFLIDPLNPDNAMHHDFLALKKHRQKYKGTETDWKHKRQTWPRTKSSFLLYEFTIQLTMIKHLYTKHISFFSYSRLEDRKDIQSVKWTWSILHSKLKTHTLLSHIKENNKGHTRKKHITFYLHLPCVFPPISQAAIKNGL